MSASNSNSEQQEQQPALDLSSADPLVYLNETHLVESTRFTEIHSAENYVAFILKKYSLKTKSSSFNLFLHNADTLQTKQMTHLDKVGLANPYLIVDFPGLENSILYLKNGQINSLPIDGGESTQISNFPLEIESFKVCRGVGAKIWLLCVFNVYPNKSLQETINHDNEIASLGTSGIVFDNLMVRHWDTWNCYAKRNHLFTCPLIVGSQGSLEIKSDELRDLMFGLETDCPSRPFGGSEEYSLSPDGRFVTIACRKWNSSSSDETHGKQPRDMAWSTDIAVFMTPIEGSSTFQQISSSSLCSVHSSPTWSPDGKKVAFTSMTHPQYESDRLQLAVYDVETQQLTFPTRDVDLSFSSILWAPNQTDSTYTLYATAQYRASTRIFRFIFDSSPDMNLSSLSVIPGDESKTSPLIVTSQSSSSSASHQIYYFEGTHLSPNILKSGKSNELFESIELYSPLTSGFQPLQSISPRLSREIYVPCPEYHNGDLALPLLSQFYFHAIGSDGQQTDELVHAWYLPPASVRTSEEEAALSPQSVPLVLIIHGGPQGAYTNAWNYRWNLSYYAAKGYGVCAVNFHGSTSFGQKFCDSIRNDWGGQPYRDCLESVRSILAHKPYLNSGKVGALGASYGGYMINWLNGHTDQFRCLVNHDGIFDLKNLYYSTEELWFPEWEFGLPWDPESGYDRVNPAKYIANWKTPTLVVQGGKDHRVVETEGLSTFTALQRQGIPSQLLYFPDENHWCLKPLNSIKWHQTVAAWLDRWLK